MNPNFKFSCGIMDTINGYKLQALEPDENGFYTIPVGCLGAPTQQKVIYDPESTIRAMNDPHTRFNISLREGYLKGEWGHPVITDPRDPVQMARLMRIDEDRISHYFGKIWIDNEKPVNMPNGEQGYRLMAKVKPTGPKGAYLEQSLRDPYQNTAFSVRCVCIPMDGPRRDCEYRKVHIMITFDAVHAPGFAIANKRYGSDAVGMECFNEYDFNEDVALQAVDKIAVGMESIPTMDKSDIRKLYNKREIYMGRELVGVNVAGKSSLITTDGRCINAASLMYGFRD